MYHIHNLSQCITNLKTTSEGLATMDNFSKQIYDAGNIEATFTAIKNVMINLNYSIDKAGVKHSILVSVSE